jgi:hypothetical protein
VRAVILNQYGGPENLALSEAPFPSWSPAMCASSFPPPR